MSRPRGNSWLALGIVSVSWCFGGWGVALTNHLDGCDVGGTQYYTSDPNCADFDGNWKVDFRDFAIFASQWRKGLPETLGDIWPPAGDGVVDTFDLAVLVENWLWEAVEPVFHLGFDENNGTTAYDSIGISHGTIYGGAEWSGGVSGGALSFDGVDDYVECAREEHLWTKADCNPMITGQFGSMWCAGPNDYHAFYSDNVNVLHAGSTDGLTWVDDAEHDPILIPDGAGTAIEVVMVWKETDIWYMLYRSNEWRNGREIGLARCTDPAGAIGWTKCDLNPVLSRTPGTWDDEASSIDLWGIIRAGSTYYLWYNDMGSWPRRSGLATIAASDLTGGGDPRNWKKDERNPIFTGNRYCIFPFRYGNCYYMLVPYLTLTGAYPQIRLYRDANPTFYPGEREYLGIILRAQWGRWDGVYLDTPSVLTLDVCRDSFPDGHIWMYYSGRADWASHSWKEGLAKGVLADLPEMKPVDETDPLSPTDALTISVWAKQAREHFGDDVGLVAKQNSYLLAIDRKRLKGCIYDAGWQTACGTTDLAADVWYHFAMAFSKGQEGGKIQLYIDGVEEGLCGTASKINETSNALWVGRFDPRSGPAFFSGTIDEVMIFDRRLTPKQIQQLCWVRPANP